MFEIKPLELATSPSGKGKSAAKEAEGRKKAAKETMEEAWVRVLAMKNSDSARAKLLDVKNEMFLGNIGRLPEKEGKKFSKAEALDLYEVLREQRRQAKLKHLVDTIPENYYLITSRQGIFDLVHDAMKEEYIGLDVETTGLDVFQDVIVGVSVTLPSVDRHYYVPFQPTNDVRALPIADLELFRPLFLSEKVGKVLHNAIFDLGMARRHRMFINGIIWDTMSAMQLLDENLPSYQLKDLGPRFLGVEADTFEELFGKDAKFAEVPLMVAFAYATKDTDLTVQLYHFQRKHMLMFPEMYEYYTTTEVPLIYSIQAMESEGFVIDLEYAEIYGKQLEQDIARLSEELLIDLGDPEINLNAPKQVKPALERVTGEYLPNMDAKKTLAPLREEYDVVDKYLTFKEYSKLLGTYVNQLPTHINSVTGRLHARFNQNGTVTGRFSSGGNGVNLQNQPKAARPLFVAPEGHVLIGADWSQQEVRCMAYFTQEPTLLRAYQDGLDIYASIASEFFGKPYEECGDGTEERKIMKTIVLALMYGMGSFALSKKLNISEAEAEDFMNTLFEKMPGIRSFVHETNAFAKLRGYVWMDGKQRKRRLPEATQKPPKGRFWSLTEEQRKKVRAINKAQRQGPNARIQGTSAIQTKKTINAVYEWLKDKPGWSLWCTVHDELIICAPEDFTREELREYERLMTETYVFGNVPNKSDIEIMRVWGKGVGVEEWFEEQTV